MEEEKVFKTTDFHVAAYLKMTGDEFLKAERLPNSGRSVFIFKYNGQENKVRDFYNGIGSFRNYAYALRDLKGLIRKCP